MRASPLALRIAASYVAMEHPSDKALKDYLKEHPNADPAKHTVKDEDEIEVTFEEEEPKGFWGKLKGLGAKAKQFIAEAPKETKRFFEDDAFRRKTLQGFHAKIESMPAAVANRVMDTVKHEVKEFKEAGEGIATVIKGGKMNDHQKKALATVGTHLAIGFTAAALTASGPLAVAGTFAKGLARHIAAKAVANAMGHLHVLDELGHIGHGVKHLMEHLASDTAYYRQAVRRGAKEGEAPDPETVLQNFIRAAVAKEINGLTDDDLEAGLKAMDGEEKTARGLRVADVDIDDVPALVTHLEGDWASAVWHRKDWEELTKQTVISPASLIESDRWFKSMLQGWNGNVKRTNDLAFYLLQHYSMDPKERKAVEAMIKWTRAKHRVPSIMDGRNRVVFAFKMAAVMADFLTVARAVVDRGASHQETSDETEGTKTKVGSFEIVNTGGFSTKVMGDVIEVFRKVERMLTAAHLDKVCYGNVYITRTISKGNVLAFYDDSTDDVYVRANVRATEGVLFTVAHELGHRYSLKIMHNKNGVEDLYNAIQRLEWQRTTKVPDVGTLVQHEGHTYEVLEVDRSGVTVMIDKKKKGKMYLDSWGNIAREVTDPDFKGFVSAYAKRGGPEENFAEMFAFYTLGDLRGTNAELFENLVFNHTVTARRIAHSYTVMV